MKTTSLTLPDDLYDRLKNEARRRGYSMAELIRRALEQELGAGFKPPISLRDIPRHRCGAQRAEWSRHEIFDEMIGDDDDRS